jgi:hypothetical protein
MATVELTSAPGPQNPDTPVSGKHHRGRDGADLPVMNALMGADRTLMVWIRASLSMLSFGFTRPY